ncbi:amino acid adenylation domain-containing protein [Hyphococcus formosus]|uniref:non-ribosomal peptide synthetase n=1 Tax=Hyphococcus formosus TaxID=3143534 RepID=UPI00398B7C62
MSVVIDPKKLETCVDMLIDEVAQANPDRVAVKCGVVEYTYHELMARAESIAATLKENSVMPGEFVGVMLERSFDMLAAVLGIMRCGAAYVPLDPDFPAKRLQHMVDDCGAKIVLTQQSLTETGPSGSFAFVVVENVRPNAAERSPVRPNDLAYILYTSGSTGLPKGVAVEHKNVVNFLLSMAESPGFTANDKLLAVTTLSFDIAGLELFLPLITGGTVVIAERNDVLDGDQLKTLIAQNDINVMQATPSTWRLLLEAGWEGGQNFKALCGGEALPRDLAKNLSACVGELWNMYGPTETTIWSTCYKVSAAGEPILIGTPIANTSVYILDKAGRQAPPGIPGEIFIGGLGVARGYLNRAELTSEKFLPDPFSKVENARMYRTGDFGRYRANGLLEYRERADAQVKIRGFRVELGDVESAIVKCENIQQAVCKIIEPSPGDTRLIAYIKSGDIDLSALREALFEILPNYMVPQHFVIVDDFPMTPNGKLDRRALPEPELHEREMENYIAPSTPTEKLVAESFAHVFELDKVSANANFFDLGGHSILAMRVLSILRRAISPRINLRMIFDARDVASLAATIDELVSADQNEKREELLF